MELAEIKIIRKKLNLTQTDLAKKSGVSQSLIAKIESNRIDPTFGNAQKIFNTLNDLMKKEEVVAEKIMQKKIIFASPEDNLRNAIQKMKRYSISQMPVMEKGIIVGLISESTILDSLLEDKGNLKVRDVMIDSPPIIPRNTTKTTVIELLKHFPLILVKDKGVIKGLISKSDILSLYK